MALLKKKDTAESFKVPSLVESSEEFAGLVAKQAELHNRYSELHAERSKLRDEIEAEKAKGGQRLSPGVAALLGDGPDSLTLLSARLREVATEMSTIEDAQEVLRCRIDESAQSGQQGSLRHRASGIPAPPRCRM
jgi:chromosome segregation ATPase